MTTPPLWTSEQLEIERLRAIDVFRRERLEEPLEDYLEWFDKYQGYVEELLETTVDLETVETAALEVLTEPRLLEAFRYLAAPPISEDDLRVLSEVTSLAKGSLRQNPDQVKKILDVVRAVLDRRRFVWIVENREPTESEKQAAIVASAALMAASRVQTNRRSLGKTRQEDSVIQMLEEIRLKKVRRRKVRTFADAPNVGEFCAESSLGGRKADVIIRPWDSRLVPVECKVSNSALNSVKRLNNDAAVKAVNWKLDFGQTQIVPIAVLAGVYNLSSLVYAQERGLCLIWGHDLGPLREWILSTRQ